MTNKQTSDYGHWRHTCSICQWVELWQVLTCFQDIRSRRSVPWLSYERQHHCHSSSSAVDSTIQNHSGWIRAFVPGLQRHLELHWQKDNWKSTAVYASWYYYMKQFWRFYLSRTWMNPQEHTTGAHLVNSWWLQVLDSKTKNKKNEGPFVCSYEQNGKLIKYFFNGKAWIGPDSKLIDWERRGRNTVYKIRRVQNRRYPMNKRTFNMKSERIKLLPVCVCLTEKKNIFRPTAKHTNNRRSWNSRSHPILMCNTKPSALSQCSRRLQRMKFSAVKPDPLWD